MDLVGMGKVEEMKKSIGVIKYTECSAKNKKKLKNVFYEVIRSILSCKPKTERKKCKIIWIWLAE